MEILTKKKYSFLSNWEFIVWNWEENILFALGMGPFQPQNQVIESPEACA